LGFQRGGNKVCRKGKKFGFKTCGGKPRKEGGGVISKNPTRDQKEGRKEISKRSSPSGKEQRKRDTETAQAAVVLLTGENQGQRKKKKNLLG